GPPPGGVERVRVVLGAGVELAAGESHGLAVEDVDRRQEDHAATRAHSAAKLSSMLRPALEDFSGWNWTPNTEPRATIVANRSRYSVVPTMSAVSAGRAANECTW